jgi:hypothetical protein
MTRWISLACALIVLTGAATFVYQTLPDSVPEPTIELHSRSSGPPARLVIVGEKVHNFGTMAAEVKDSHTWEFRNTGEGPLEIWLEDTSCSCTVANFAGDADEPDVPGEPKKADKPKKKVTVAPGGSTPIEVSWVAHRWGRFGQAATLGTNDSDNSSVVLSIVGTIIAPVDVQPSETVTFPGISNEEAHRANLEIVSADRPDLKLTRIASSKPGLIAAEARPMAREELERKKLKSGYNLAVEIKPGMPLGRFTEDLVIDTDHPRRPSLKLTIAGNTVGPISVTPERLLMFNVPSRKGGSQDLALLVRGDGETHFEVASKPEKLEISITREEKPEARGRYRLRATVPPGTPPGVLDDPIVLKTDHPKVSELRIPVSIYVSSRSEAG